MATPFKIDMTIASGQTVSGGVYIAEVDVRSIQFPATMTGTTLTLTGYAIDKRSGNNADTGTYASIADTGGTDITITFRASKLVVLSEALRDAIASCHWLKLTSNSTELADRTISLIGISRYR